MRTPNKYQLVGLATAVSAVVVRPAEKIVIDAAVPGEVRVGRGGMVCNTLAVASALGARVGGVIASGSDAAGAATRETVTREGIMASFVATRQTPVTVTIAEGTTRSSIMGSDGEREADLDPEAVEAAWNALAARPVWVMLTLPALDSPAGQRFVSLAQRTGARVALTLSSAGHVRARALRLQTLMVGVDLVFGNADEYAALLEADVEVPLMLTTVGERGAHVMQYSEVLTRVPVETPGLVRDTTGAGDAFAAGVLSVLDPQDLSQPAIEHAVQVGHRAASVIIANMGAEPGKGATVLREIGRDAGL
jgi:sugar/nucleoside kinase (ribokinase family)